MADADRALGALVAIAVGIFALAFPFVASGYHIYQGAQVLILAIALLGLNLLTGFNGQISLGHGAFMAVGAYTTALLMTHTQANFILEVLAAIGVAAALGLVIGIPATRLKGPYLAGMTLMVALALPPIADKWSATFGGDQGLTTVVPTAPGTINPEEWLAWIQIGGALLTLVLLANLLRSRFGITLRAVRDNEVAASLAGICGMSVPCGETAAGLPIGVQVLGPHFGEATMLRVGAAIEAAQS